MSDDLRISRRPYTVQYYKDGQKHTIRRRPPEKQHNLLPTDVVELKSQRGDSFPVHENYEIKHINNRHPNTLQLVNEVGETTFVSHREVELREAFIPREGITTEDSDTMRRYLLWP